MVNVLFELLSVALVDDYYWDMRGLLLSWVVE